ncbi:GNAT family N-acetyltransferase [Chitinophaga sp. S165]|uniref:GNAT family N-acetyltransferase n=1 Tax=Chitinophaga sp. S165 TaxID=2135462 RepID=UPI000D715910|nr:GNAT family N-acetyltransferase [Chitinophaga sp. S165]PWV57071.1 ribosomal protein S18 acetylase RimI-like enzyme [Chitinophaga sp. S165]
MAPLSNEVKLVYYIPAYQPHFERLNKWWIEKYFTVEPVDVDVLGNPDQHIIAKGGDIIFAAIGETIVGTVALKTIDAESAEMTKMAVDEAYQGHRIGWKLAEGILEVARKRGLKKVVLYSNTKLVPAISMYQKLGFREISVEEGRYERSTIKMEIVFGEENRHYAVADNLIRTINAAVPLLLQIPEIVAAERVSRGKWSPKEIIGHLIDSAINNNVRFIRSQQISLLEIPGYTQDFWVKGQAWQLSSWQELIELWSGMNKHLALTIRAIPAGALQHLIKINENEPVTLEYVVTDYLEHLKHHLSQVKIIL